MSVLHRPGLDLSFEVAGDGDRKPTIALGHGFCATSAMFAENVAALTVSHRVITWDLRGHGRSDSPEDPSLYSPALAVGDILALLDHVGVDRAVIAGHSLGGYLSLDFALAHPERTSALVLIDTGPGYRNDEARAGWNRLADRYATALEEDGLAGVPVSDELSADLHRDTTGLALVARGILAQTDSHVLDGLSSIAVPTLVVVGSEDKNFIAGSEHMARKIAGARLVVVDGAGHAPNISHRAQFDAALRSFLDGQGA